MRREDKMEIGDVVICETTQAGTIVQKDKEDTWVLLRNGDIWVGLSYNCRLPQSKEDLDACPINVKRLESKPIPRED